MVYSESMGDFILISSKHEQHTILDNLIKTMYFKEKHVAFDFVKISTSFLISFSALNMYCSGDITSAIVKYATQYSKIKCIWFL